jgi:flagellar basal-body rod protein FlgB
VIANNISSQNVPGFKRQVVRFEELLAAQLDSGIGDLASIQPRIDTDRLTPAGPDGNNVSMELERNAMVENRLLYDTYAQILQTRTDMMRLAIQER